MTFDRDSLGRAIAAAFAAIRECEVDPDRVDLSTPLFEGGGFLLDGRALDSLEIAEALVALERELEIEILGRARAQELRSIQAIAEFVAASAEPQRLASFQRNWRPPPALSNAVAFPGRPGP